MQSNGSRVILELNFFVWAKRPMRKSNVDISKQQTKTGSNDPGMTAVSLIDFDGGGGYSGGERELPHPDP